MRLTEAEFAELQKKRPLTVKDNNKAIQTKAEIQMQNAIAIHPENKMNKLEGSYAQYLDLLKYQNKIVEWRFEPLNLRLASPKCYYRIDFLVINTLYQVELIETKGDWVDGDALVKFKVAAETFPFFIFKWVTRKDGEWITRILRGGQWING